MLVWFLATGLACTCDPGQLESITRLLHAITKLSQADRITSGKPYKLELSMSFLGLPHGKNLFSVFHTNHGPTIKAHDATHPEIDMEEFFF